MRRCPEATLLLGIEDLAVTCVTRDGDGITEVHAITRPDLDEQSPACPECRNRGIIKQRPCTRPRDFPWGPRTIRLKWRKLRRLP